MTIAKNGQHLQPLPEELAAALRRATTGTLGTFQLLRAALREHVHRERSRGASLAEIDADLRLMIDRAGDGDGNGEHSAQHIDELTAQMLTWSGVLYSSKT